MLVENTRNLMNKVKTLLESKYEELTPLKYIVNKYQKGASYSFEKSDKDIKYTYSVSFNSSPDLLKRTITDPNFKDAYDRHKDVLDKQPKYLLSFRAPFQKGKIYPPFEEEVNFTIAQIVKNFSTDRDFLPKLIILDPIMEEKSINTDLIMKTLSNSWVKESYLDINNSLVHLFIKAE